MKTEKPNPQKQDLIINQTKCKLKLRKIVDYLPKLNYPEA